MPGSLSDREDTYVITDQPFSQIHLGQLVWSPPLETPVLLAISPGFRYLLFNPPEPMWQHNLIARASRCSPLCCYPPGTLCSKLREDKLSRLLTQEGHIAKEAWIPDTMGNLPSRGKDWLSAFQHL